MKKHKDGGATTEQEFSEMLKDCGRQCQHEIRAGMHTGYARCQEIHLEKSKDPERKGFCQLTTVKLNRTKKLYCQWHVAELQRYVLFHAGPIKRPVIEDANQVGMFA